MSCSASLIPRGLRERTTSSVATALDLDGYFERRSEAVKARARRGALPNSLAVWLRKVLTETAEGRESEGRSSVLLSCGARDLRAELEPIERGGWRYVEGSDHASRAMEG